MRCMYGGKIRLHGEVSWQEMESLKFQKLWPAEEPYTSRLMFMPLWKANFQIHGRALTLLGDLAAKAIQEMGVPNVIFWATAAVQAAHAMQFSRTFLSSLRDPLSSSLEVIMLVIGCAHQLHRNRISKNLFPEMCQPALYEPLHATKSTLVHHARYWSAPGPSFSQTMQHWQQQVVHLMTCAAGFCDCSAVDAGPLCHPSSC